MCGGWYRTVYEEMAENRAQDVRLAPTECAEMRCGAREVMFLQWKEDMALAPFGRRALDAIGLVIDEWVERPHGFLSYRLVQVLTGHGCFGAYLHRIGREESPSCHHCDEATDTLAI